jgi:hypothetical protein
MMAFTNHGKAALLRSRVSHLQFLFVIWRIVLLFSALVVTGPLRAQSGVTISVDTQQPGAAISPDFEGLSFEMSQLFPDEKGVRYFRPDNRPLIALFQSLGIKNLRVGGNTADRNWKKAPDKADVDSLFAFAKAAGIKVIYCLRLHDGDAAEDAATAKYIMDHYPDQIDCFSIGQEPNVYPKDPITNQRPTYADFAKGWKQFEGVIAAAAPGVKFCGPSVDDSPVWQQQFMRDFGRGDHVALITTHLYPGRSGEKVPSPEIGRDRMLSDDFVDADQKLYLGFAATALADGFPYRLEEANNYFNGGATDVSDTFASALWGLDFMYWWAEHDAAGINFHTGDRVAAGAEMRGSRYTAYFSTADGFTVRPLGYGIKAFDIGSHGKLVPAILSNPQNLDLTAYAVLGDDQCLYLTIINKEHGNRARPADVTLAGTPGYGHAQVIALTAPHNDITAKEGVTLGRSKINDDGSWHGTWTRMPTDEMGLFTLKMPATTACIIRLTAD